MFRLRTILVMWLARMALELLSPRIDGANAADSGQPPSSNASGRTVKVRSPRVRR